MVFLSHFYFSLNVICVAFVSTFLPFNDLYFLSILVILRNNGSHPFSLLVVRALSSQCVILVIAFHITDD